MRSRRIQRSDNLRYITYDSIKVATIQLPVEENSNPTEYLDLVCPYMQEAVARGAQLIVFPELVAAPLLGAWSELMGEELIFSQRNEDVNLKEEIANVLFQLGGVLKKVHHTVFSSLAEGYGVYVAAGSLLSDEGGPLRNTGYLFGPNGDVVGRQDQTHISRREREMGLVPGNDVSVFETRLGTLGLTMSTDAQHFEPYRFLSLKGAEIVITFAAYSRRQTFWEILRETWARAQESDVYAVRSCLVGDLFGAEFSGKSGVYAPLEITDDGDGIVVEVDNATESGVLVAELDLTELRRYREEEGFQKALNPLLYHQEFFESYENEYEPQPAQELPRIKVGTWDGDDAI